MEQPKVRPPYVTFEYRAEEDRAASIAAGHFVSTDVAYALITPQGSKERVERQADEWLLQLERQVEEGRADASWLATFQARYSAWKSNAVMPVDGTAIANWPPASPAMTKNLQALHILTVEDLAVANEQALNAIGMGGRALKETAQKWLENAKHGIPAVQLQALQQENEGLRTQLLDLEEKFKQLAQKFGAQLPGTAP